MYHIYLFFRGGGGKMQNKAIPKLSLRLAHPHEAFMIIKEAQTEEECKHVCRCDASLCTMKCPGPRGKAGCKPGELYTRYRWKDYTVEGMTIVKDANGEDIGECMCSVEVVEKSGNLIQTDRGLKSKTKLK